MLKPGDSSLVRIDDCLSMNVTCNVTEVADHDCPKGWIARKSGCYKLTAPTSWAAAKETCIVMGAKLLQLDGKANKLNVQEWFDIRYISSYTYMWVARGSFAGYVAYRYSQYLRYFTPTNYRFPGLCKKCKYLL